MTKRETETAMFDPQPNWTTLNGRGEPVIPVVIQNAETKVILDVAYTNEEAFIYTMKNRAVALWSISRNVMWVKGELAGNPLTLVEARINCGQGALLYMVKPANAACHTTTNDEAYSQSCFYKIIKHKQEGPSPNQ